LREWITTDSRNTPSTTNPEDEEMVDAPGNDGNASVPEQVKRSNPWRRRRRVMMMKYFLWGKGGRCIGLTSLPPACAECLEIWEPHPPATPRACPGL